MKDQESHRKKLEVLPILSALNANAQLITDLKRSKKLKEKAMSNFQNIKVQLRLTIGFAVANRAEEVYLHEYTTEDEWNKLNIFEKEDFLEQEILNDWANNYIEKSVWVEEAEGG